MKFRLLSWRICLVTLVTLSSLSSCLEHKSVEQQITVTPTSRQDKATPSSTETPNVVLTAFAEFPTPVLLPTSTAIMISTPTRQQVERFEFPVLPFGWKGADVDYITVRRTSTYLSIWGCFGTDLRDLEENVTEMQVRFLVNGQVIDKTRMLQFDHVPRPSEIDRTFAILFSGWQANTTTKLEIHYSLYQVSTIDGIHSNRGNYYEIVYVNAQ